MPLTPGSRIGPYEIVAPIGAGGMGEVYRARDTKLHRDVAIKVLPDLFATDPERLARFEREAQTLAALNHPHIAQVYGVEDRRRGARHGAGGRRGSCAANRPVGPIPLEEACRSRCRSPRRSKPRTSRGSFTATSSRPTSRCVAMARSRCSTSASPRRSSRGPGDASRNLENSPTITSPFQMSQHGVILGTAAYMAPGAGEGKTGRQARRHLGVRLRALRDAHRQAAVRRGGHHRHPRRHRPRRPGLVGASAGHPAGRAHAPAPVPGERSRASGCPTSAQRGSSCATRATFQPARQSSPRRARRRIRCFPG